MRVKNFNLAKLTLLLCAMVLVAASSHAQRVSDSREIGKTVSLRSGGNFHLESKHSDVRIHHWDKEQVKFEIKMKASGKSERDVSRLLGTIHFDVNEGSEGLHAEVWMGPFSNMNSWDDRAEFTLKDGTKISGIYEYSLEVDIYMPREARLKVAHSFGNLVIKDMHRGEMRLESQHGNISMGDACCRLQIDLAHGNLEMGEAEELNLEMRHSNASVGSAKNLNLEAQHSNLNLGSVGRLDTEAGHSNLSIGQVSQLRIENNHSSLKIGRLLKSLEAESNHGNIKIKALQSNFESIAVQLNFGDLEIGVGGGANFRLNYEGQHGQLKVGDGFRYDHKGGDEHGHYKEIRGHQGSGGGTISIKTQHGNAVVE